jgi:hypothetical protein
MDLDPAEEVDRWLSRLEGRRQALELQRRQVYVQATETGSGCDLVASFDLYPHERDAVEEAGMRLYRKAEASGDLINANQLGWSQP